MNDAVLVCDNLTKTYAEGPEQLTVLKAVQLQVHKGERIAIVGSSGSGKTTLLNMLAGLDKPTEGTVLVAGQNISTLNEQQRGELRNQHLGFVYQFHHLLPEFSALENVAMPLLLRKDCSVTEARNRASELLDMVGLAARATHKPSELSGGERQRVAIARALVTRPNLVLMDEPTGNLDAETGEKVHQLMLNLAERLHTAFVVVTHDTGLAERLDRQLRLVAGELVEQRGVVQ